MADHPIIMSGESVRAIEAGRKTQTRRVIIPQPILVDGTWTWPFDGIKSKASWSKEISNPESMIRFCPYGGVGDRLWVKEIFRYVIIMLGCGGTASGVEYKDGTIRFSKEAYKYAKQPTNKDKKGQHAKWRSPIFMPKWAARIWRKITGIRTERVQEISKRDVIAEGIKHCTDLNKMESDRFRYLVLWDSLNAKRGYPWELNPWVWVIEFKREPK